MNNPITRLSKNGLIAWLLTSIGGVLILFVDHSWKSIGQSMVMACFGYILFGFLIRYRLPSDQKLPSYPEDLKKMNLQYDEILKLKDKPSD